MPLLSLSLPSANLYDYVLLSWFDSDNETSYRIERKELINN